MTERMVTCRVAGNTRDIALGRWLESLSNTLRGLMAQEFARLPLRVPEHKPTRYAFEGRAQRHRSDRISEQQAGRTLSAIGTASSCSPRTATRPPSSRPPTILGAASASGGQPAACRKS